MGVNRIIGTPDEARRFSLFAAAMTRVMTNEVSGHDISLSVIEIWRLVISLWLFVTYFLNLDVPML